MKILTTFTLAGAMLALPALMAPALDTAAAQGRMVIDESGTQVSMRDARSGAADLEVLGADQGFVVFRNPQGGFFRMQMTDLCNVDPGDFLNDDNADRANASALLNC